MIPRRKAKSATPVQLEGVSKEVVEAVTPSWSAVLSQWATAASAIAVAVTLLGNIYLQHLAANAAAVQAKDAAVKVEEVKTALEVSDTKQDAKLDGLATVADATHTLVNANFGAQLKISAIALRRLALLTKDPDDLAAAELAEKLLKEHDAKQRSVDDDKHQSNMRPHPSLDDFPNQLASDVVPISKINLSDASGIVRANGENLVAGELAHDVPLSACIRVVGSPVLHIHDSCPPLDVAQSVVGPCSVRKVAHLHSIGARTDKRFKDKTVMKD